MNIIDLLIGLTLMNAMPHFILGIWKGRMLSAFGFGDTKNILYGLLNFAVSLGLFVSRYGTEQLFKNGIYVGALVLLIIYFLTGRLWYSIFHDKHFEKTTTANLIWRWETGAKKRMLQMIGVSSLFILDQVW